MSSVLTSLLSCLVWPAIISLPLVLTSRDLYKHVFPSDWYDEVPRDFWNQEGHFHYDVVKALGLGGAGNFNSAAANSTYSNKADLSVGKQQSHSSLAFSANSIWPSPVGLILGLLAVVVGQVFMLAYFCWMRSRVLETSEAERKSTAIQREGARPYEMSEGLVTHLSQPEGFVLLGGYLSLSWMLGLMPASYYSFSGGINWGQVAAQLLIQDFVQYIMHLLEHKLDKNIYILSHKPHHRFTNPRLFDAFNGSLTDTIAMILIPLIVTARLVNANVWTYMAFGSLYANWLSLIHAEYPHPWDRAFRLLGLGTAADHHVHHKLFVYNYGHTFMYWDRLFGTYKSPDKVPLFNKDV